MGDVTITTNSLNKQINSGNLPPAEHDKLSIHKFNRLDAPSCFLSRQRESTADRQSLPKGSLHRIPGSLPPSPWPRDVFAKPIPEEGREMQLEALSKF